MVQTPDIPNDCRLLDSINLITLPTLENDHNHPQENAFIVYKYLHKKKKTIQPQLIINNSRDVMTHAMILELSYHSSPPSWRGKTKSHLCERERERGLLIF